jgi:hypothetical protein
VKSDGTGDGTKLNPMNLLDALERASSQKNILLLQAGNYQISETIEIDKNNLIIEGFLLFSDNNFLGGYNSLWQKDSSLRTILTITPPLDRTEIEVDSSIREAPQYIGSFLLLFLLTFSGIQILEVSNVILKDISVHSVASSSHSTGKGYSVYGIHVLQSYNISFSRIQVESGPPQI